MRLGLIGFGEVGYAIAKGLKEQGLENLCVYDVALAKDEPNKSLLQKAKELKVDVCKSVEEIAEKSDVLFSLNSSKAAVGVAKELAPFLGERHLFVDLNTSSPEIQEEIYKVLESSRCKFVDAAIMGAISSAGHRTSIIAAGDGRQEFYEKFSPLEMNIDPNMVEKPGQASALKLYRSIFAKGIETLVIEMLTASYRYGVDEQVFSLVCSWMNKQKDFFQLFKTLTVMHAVHAERRTVEMEHVCRSIEKVGMEPIMSEATKNIMKRTSDFDSQSSFKEVNPEDYMKVIDFLDKKIAAEGDK